MAFLLTLKTLMVIQFWISLINERQWHQIRQSGGSYSHQETAMKPDECPLNGINSLQTHLKVEALV